MAACWQAVVVLAVRFPDLNLKLLWATLPLVGALLLGAVIISWVKQWRKRTAAGGLTTNDQLAHFRTLYERGQLSPTEFERIRALLAERLRQETRAAEDEAMEIKTLEAPSAENPPGTDSDGENTKGDHPPEPPQRPEP